MSKKVVYITIAFVITLLVAAWIVLNYSKEMKDENMGGFEDTRSFEDCVESGQPVMESYPRQCATPDGRTFVEPIGADEVNHNANEDSIVIESPEAGAIVSGEIMVKGKARGPWFFEASFPFEIVDINGNVIVSSYVTAEGDWMTEDFVDFSSKGVSIPAEFTGPATLILRKDNPSDLPENDGSISFPIVIQ